MPLDKVVYSRTFHLGDHNFEKIGTEGNIGEGETKEQLRNEAVKFVYDSFVDLHPELNVALPPSLKKEETYFDTPTEERPGTHLDTSSPEFIKMEIGSCKTIKILESYKFIVKGKSELEEIYNRKLKELSK